MKCIKEHCKYYSNHDFNASCRVCILDNTTFIENNGKICQIEKIINKKIINLEKLVDYKEYIKWWINE